MGNESEIDRSIKKFEDLSLSQSFEEVVFALLLAFTFLQTPSVAS